jgi:hypothetical protein
VQIINKPIPLQRSDYDDLIKKIVDRFSDKEEVLSIYQLGHVKDIGISDLDVVVIFKNNSSCDVNFHEGLNVQEKSILTHNLFGVTEDTLQASLAYNYFDNFKLLAGKDLAIDPDPANDLPQELQVQIAYEFLHKFFVALDVQVSYGILKMRSFLLSAKAVMFDLRILGIKEGALFDMVNNVISWRKEWFTDPPSNSEVSKFVKQFHQELEDLLNDQLPDNNYYLPKTSFKISGNIEVAHGPKLFSDRKGFVFPLVFSFLGKKYFNLQNRFNSFRYEAPFTTPEKNSLFDDRFAFYKQAYLMNRSNYPHFIPLSTGFRYFYDSGN